MEYYFLYIGLGLTCSRLSSSSMLVLRAVVGILTFTSPGHKSQYLQISVLSVWGVMTDVLYSALLAAVHCSQLSQAATSQLETE